MASFRSMHVVASLAIISVAFPAPANESDNLRDAIKRLDSCVTDDCSPAVATLVQGGIDSLRFFFEQDDVSSVAAHFFRSRVIPDLPPDEAGPLLLDRFRKSEAVFEEFDQLAKRVEAGEDIEDIDDDDPAYTDHIRRYNRARWTAAALGNLKYRRGYEAVYAQYLQLHEFRSGHFDLAQGLFGMDPERALRDFTRLIQSERDFERVKGVISFRQVARTPECGILRELFDDPVEKVRTEAYQLLHYTQRDCVQVPTDLVANRDQNVRQASEMRLQYLASMPDIQLQGVMGNATTPEQRAAIWRDWWRSAAELTNEQLRQRGLEAALSVTDKQLDAQLIAFVFDYADDRVCSLLKHALSSSDKEIQKAAPSGILRLAARGEQAAVILLLKHVESLSVTEAAALAGAMAKLQDPRIVPLLLRLLNKAPMDPPESVRSILLALGNTKDSRAVEPVLSILLTRDDGTEQHAAMALAKLEGAASVQPRLLTRLINERNHNTRYALREIIRTIGGPSLARELTTILPNAGAGDDSFEGPQKDVLALMEEFPDPAARSLLRELLGPQNRFSRLYAARALAKLGDTSGASVVLEELFAPHSVPYHFYAHDVGKALKDIGDPETRRRLEDLCLRVHGDKRQRVLQVIAQQRDPSYIPFLAIMIRQDDLATRCGAAVAISRLIYHTPNTAKRRGLNLTLDSDVNVAKAMLRWAFRDECPNPDCGQYPDHSLLKRMNGAVVEISEKRFARYEAATDSLVALSSSSADDRALIGKAKPRNEDTCAFGSLNVEESQGFMSAFLCLDYGCAGYLFQSGGLGWRPICATGGLIE